MMKKRYRLQSWEFEFNLAEQDVRNDHEALQAARMGVRIRGSGGLQYFMSLLSSAGHGDIEPVISSWEGESLNQSVSEIF
mgnify:CR=1 FL=1